MTYTLTVELLGTTEFIDGHISYRVPDHSNWLQKKIITQQRWPFSKDVHLKFFPFWLESESKIIVNLLISLCS